MSTQYADVTPIEIQAGREGLWGIRNRNMVPVGGVIELRNATLEDHTWRTGGGATVLGVTLGAGVTIGCGIDYWPDSVTQRTLAAGSDGNVYKDDGTGNGWIQVKSGLTTGGNPFWVLGGAEAAGRNRKAFLCDGINRIQVLSGDGGVGSMTNIASPPADWSGANQPTGLCIHQGYNWGYGNANSRHTLYRSLQGDHEDFLTTPYSLNVFPGESQYISAALSFKGGMLVWKYPENVYFIDTADPNPSNWQIKRVGRAGAPGPACCTLLENDAVWVAPDGSWHLISATYAIGSVHASDIAYRKLSSIPREQLNLSKLSAAQLVYYSQKQEVHLACAASGQNAKTRRLVLDLNRQQDLGERWHIWDRDQNETLFLRKAVDNTLVPVMGDNIGQVWLLDQSVRSKAGAGYTFEFFMADTDFSPFAPQWAGKWKNLRYLQLEWDPRSAATLSIEVWLDGVQRQSIAFTMASSGLVLPFTLPGLFGAQTLQVSRKRRGLGRFKRLALRGVSTVAGADVSITRLIVGVSIGE